MALTQAVWVGQPMMQEPGQRAGQELVWWAALQAEQQLALRGRLQLDGQVVQQAVQAQFRQPVQLPLLRASPVAARRCH